MLNLFQYLCRNGAIGAVERTPLHRGRESDVYLAKWFRWGQILNQVQDDNVGRGLFSTTGSAYPRGFPWLL
jgi:hypothetical protein